MSESPDTPVAIDRVDRARGEGDRVRLRLSGRRLRTDHVDDEPLLVIQLQGRRHRFPADPAQGAPVAGGAWEATFTVPSWAEPRRAGQAAVWLGNAVVPMPLPGEASAAQAPAVHPVASWARPAERFPAPPALGQARAAECPSPSWYPSHPPAAGVFDESEAIVDTGRTGPLAELLFRENVTALHSELEQRSADVGRLRGTLADAQAQLTARATTQAALEVAHAELRSELQQLMAAAGAQREDFDRRLGEITADRDRLQGELDVERERLTAELDSERARLQSELAGQRDRLTGELNDERDRLTAERDRLAGDRDRLAAELAGVRAEHDSERGRAGETAAELGAERDRLTEEVAALRAQLHEASSRGQGQDDDLYALREQLATTQVSRDAAGAEAESLRAELDRLGTELAVSREQLAAQGGDLGEAQRLLADARAMTEQLRGQNPH